MEKKSELLKLIPEQGILPLYFHKDSDVSIGVLKALYQAGIKTVEYTNRGEAALKNFEKMRRVRDTELKGMYLGVGTIKDGVVAQAFIDIGADYIISPGLVESVAHVADKYNMLWIPGCMTPTEIIRAETLGAKMVKLFPGNILGPSYMEAIKVLFPNLLFIPTGGVDLNAQNLTSWFKAGVCAVGLGSKLITEAVLENKQYDELAILTKKTLQLVQSVRK